MKYNLQATCALGLEAVVARELKALGIEDAKSNNGSVAFTGGNLEIAKANVWLRSADRVWLELAQFPCHSFEDLFQGTKAICWRDYFPGNACFPVDAHSHNSLLTSIPAIQRTAKKAIVECMQQLFRRQELPENGPKFGVKVFLVNDVCKIMLDTSGSGLHRRGYRTLNAVAPLRETLASALVQLTYWNKERLLVDPFCGSGTIAIEAAMLGLRMAPGMNRQFAAQHWPFVGRKAWELARDEAEDLFDRTTRLQICGFDNDSSALGLARVHLQQSGLENRGIHFERQDVANFRIRQKYGVMITNPPYGERMLEQQEAEALYEVLGNVCRGLPTWSLYIICSHPGFAEHFGLPITRRRKVYNGLIPCVYYQIPGPKPPAPKAENVQPIE